MNAPEKVVDQILREVLPFFMKVQQPTTFDRVIYAIMPLARTTVKDLDDIMADHFVVQEHRQLARDIYTAEATAIKGDIITKPDLGIMLTVKATKDTTHLHDGTDIADLL